MDSASSAQHDALTLAGRVRRIIVIVIIASFSVAAIAGIAVLLGDINADPAYQVLATTALVGVFSIAIFCGALLIGRAWQWFGLLTIAVSLVTLVRLLWLVWAEPTWSQQSVEFTFSLCIVTAAAAVASLLLLLVTHRARFVQVALFATLVLLTLGVTLTIMVIYGAELQNSDAFPRLMGIVWILAALGVVVLPIMSLILRGKHDPHASERAPAADHHATDIPVPTAAAASHVASPVGDSLGSAPGTVATVTVLSTDSIARIEAAAQAEGVTPDELIARVFPLQNE